MKKSLVYTRTGDSGTTSLVDGSRVAKTHPRIEAYGTIDELNSSLGLLRAFQRDCPVADADFWDFLQSKLFDIGAYLANPASEAPTRLDKADVERVEASIDALDAEVPPLRYFVLPTGTVAATQAHVCRTVCRRAERLVIWLDNSETAQVDSLVLEFINRLSDWLFVAARRLNVLGGVEDTPWKP